MKHFNVFGFPCYVHVSTSQRSKLDAKVRKNVLKGYGERKKGWKCMDPVSDKFIVSRYVVFDEASSYFASQVLPCMI